MAQPTTSGSRSLGSSWEYLASGSTPSPSSALLKKLRAALGSAIGRQLTAADMARLCGLPAENGDTLEKDTAMVNCRDAYDAVLRRWRDNVSL